MPIYKHNTYDMKKILILTLTILLSLSVFGRPRENPAVVDKRVSDWVINQLTDMGYTVLPEVIVQDTLNRHGKKIEFDDLYYQPSKDGKRVKRVRRDYVKEVVDTLVKENPNIQVTYINNYDPFFYSNMIGRFYHGGFNYWMYSSPWYYSNWMYDPYDFYWDMRFSGYPYYNQFYFGYNYWNPWRFNYGWGHNWYGNNYNWYGQHNNYYSNNNFGNRQQPQYGRRERPSNLSSNYNNNVERRVAPQNKPMYQQQNRRPYTPSYDSPRLSTRPAFNNSKPDALGRQYERRGNMNGTGQGIMNGNRQGMMNNMQERRGNMNIQKGTESRTQTRTYQPQPNRNYNTPSRSYSPPAQNRGSESQGFGRTFNFDSGSERRSSGTSNFSSGSNNSNSSSSSGSSGGRSSGGSSTGRR